MAYKVAIRKNATREIREIEMDLDWHDHSLFWWTQGNFGCDCNRELTFEPNGTFPDPEDPPCGHERFTVLYVEFPDGKRIFIDTPPAVSGE